MDGLTHGSDLRLAPTLGPIGASLGGSPRQAIKRVASAGFAAVQLDATLPGLRPRELDTSARKDLASTLARSGLELAGLDFFIPVDHFEDPAHQDRAVEAACAACHLAGQLGRVPVSLGVSLTQTPQSVFASLLEACEVSGARPVIFDTAGLDGMRDGLASRAASLAMAGIDPAEVLTQRGDPTAAVHALGDCLGVARLSDAHSGQADLGRVPAGAGDLDLMAYRVAVDLAPARIGPVVLDLRGLSAPLDGARAAQSAWQRAAMSL